MHSCFRGATPFAGRAAVMLTATVLAAACGEAPSGLTEADAEQPFSLASDAPSAPELATSREALAAGTYTLHPQGSNGLCLDVANGKNANSVRVQIAKCNGGAAQQWTRKGNNWTIFGDKCLNVSGGSNRDGTRLQIWKCVDGDINSQWTLKSGQIQWTKHQRCLDVVDGALRDGTETQIWTCDAKGANKNQLWGWSAVQAAAASPAAAAQPAKTTTTSATTTTTNASTANAASGVALIGPAPAGLDVAPYFWTWAQWGDYPVRTLAEGVSKAKLKSATISFELSAASGSCKAQGAFAGMGDDIKAFRKQGGRVILSYGGASDDPPYLQKSCGDAKSLASVISGQMDTYDTHNLDFDIEGDNLGDTTSNNRLVDALAILQQRYSDLYVSYTLPVDAYSGLPTTAVAVIRRSIDKGVKVSRVNLMTMDYGQMPPKGKSSADMVLGSVEATVAQLKKLYPSASSAAIYHMVGITPLIGQNDPPGSGSFYFTVSDAKAVAAYAKEKGIGLLSYWGLMRDRSGSSSSNNDYSNTPQKDFDFLNTFRSAQ